MSLVADYSDSQSSSGDDDDCNEAKEKQTVQHSNLPSASSLLAKKAGEVFDNRYQQEERAKKASLEQHVKMVENDDHLKIKNGKKICWNYRKGRCRFGSKCQYAHDSDLVMETTKPALIETDVHSTAQRDISTKDSKRKRPGLSDSLIPGKKVLKAYKKEQQQRP